GEAVPDADGYALALQRADAVRLELAGVSVEALPVRVPERVATEPLESLDLRMLNIFGVVFIGAMVAIASAGAEAGGGVVDDDSVGRPAPLAHFVAQPPPPPPRPTHARKAPVEPRGEQTAAVAARPAPPHPAKKGGDVAKQVGQALSGLLEGIGNG